MAEKAQKFFEWLKQITKTIIQIYDELAQIEKRVGITCDEYKAKVQELDRAITIENDIYSQWRPTKDMIKIVSSYTCKSGLSLSEIRLGNRICTKVMSLYQKVKDTEIYEQYNKKKPKSMFTDDDWSKYYDEQDAAMFASTINIMSLIVELFLLQDKISTSYGKTRKSLIDDKYINISHKIELERLMLENGFDIGEIAKQKNTPTPTDENYNIEIYGEEKYQIALAEIESLITKYAGCNNSTLMLGEDYSGILIVECSIRTALLKLNPSEQESIKETINEILEECDSYNMKIPSLLLKAIKNAFAKTNQDHLNLPHIFSYKEAALGFHI